MGIGGGLVMIVMIRQTQSLLFKRQAKDDLLVVSLRLIYPWSGSVVRGLQNNVHSKYLLNSSILNSNII